MRHPAAVSAGPLLLSQMGLRGERQSVRMGRLHPAYVCRFCYVDMDSRAELPPALGHTPKAPLHKPAYEV